MHLRRLGVAFAVFGALAVSASGAAAARPIDAARDGGIGVRLLTSAGVASRNPLAHSYIVGALAPGTSVRRRIEISNSTRHAATVAVYPGAASLRRGLFGFASGRKRNELARWTSLSRSVVHLPAGGRAPVTVTVTVPRTASAGERYAVVWAELAGAANGGVRLVNRVGVRVYLIVGPGGAAPAAFTVGGLTATRSAAGAPLVRATVRNTGSSTLAIDGSLTLSHGPGASSAGPFPAPIVGALSPGASTEVRVRLGRRLPAGPWTARLDLRSGQVDRVVVTRLSFPLGHALPVAPIGGHGEWTRHLEIVLVVLGLFGVAALFALVVTGRMGLLRPPRVRPR